MKLFIIICECIYLQLLWQIKIRSLITDVEEITMYLSSKLPD